MPITRARSRPRCHSRSSARESSRPDPAKADALESTSDVPGAFTPSPGIHDYDLSNVLEHADLLAQYLGATEPPSLYPIDHDDCIGLSSCSELGRRSSIQPPQRSKRMRFQRHSLQLHLPRHSTPGAAVVEAHCCNTISTPISDDGVNSSSFWSQHPVSSASTIPTAGPWGDWSHGNHLKAALFSSTENEATIRHLQNSPLSITRHAGNAHLSPIQKEERTQLGMFANRIRADDPSEIGPQSESVRRGPERNPVTSLNTSDSQRAHILEQPQEQSPAMVASCGRTNISNSNQVPPTFFTSLISPSLDETQKHTYRFNSSGKRGSCSSSEVSESRREANLIAQAKFPARKEILAPESPGIVNTTTDRPQMPRPPLASVASPMKDSHSLLLAEALTLQQTGEGLRSYQSSTPPSSEKLIPPCTGPDECERGSLASLPTTTLDCHNLTDTSSSYRSSSESETSIQSTNIISQKISSEPERFPAADIDQLLTAELFANELKMEPRISTASRAESRASKNGDADRGRIFKTPERPGSLVSVESHSSTEANVHPKTMLNWRMARKAKVREYKMRDLDVSRAEVIDSTTRRSASPGAPDAHHSIPLQISKPMKTTRRLSILNITATSTVEAPSRPNQVEASNMTTEIYHGSHLNNAKDQTQAKDVHPNIQLSISPIIATVIEPTPLLEKMDWRTSSNKLSPIMVIADVESRPGSPTLRFTAQTRPESSMPRTTLRPIPLKIKPQVRQKSHTVTISRNPSTGAIERNTVPALDAKFGRRSLMTMPTPPLSPEPIQASKHLSLPPVPLHLPIAFKGRILPLRRQGWHSPHADGSGPELESEPESASESAFESGRRSRSTTLRERVMREKLQKEKEIMDIVAKTVGLPQQPTGYHEEPNPMPLEQHNAEILEKRLTRLEKNNDAWLCAMKPLLEAMGRTLDDMREDDKSGSLRMSDFIIDTESEAGRVSYGLPGTEENTPTRLPNSFEIKAEGTKREGALQSFDPTSFDTVPQDIYTSSFQENGANPVLAAGQSSPGKKAMPTTFSATRNSNTRRPLRLQCSADDLSSGLETASSKPTGNETSPDAVGAMAEAETPAASSEAIRDAESGSLTGPKQTSDLPDLDPLIWELGSMSRKLKEIGAMNHKAADGSISTNALSPVMQELMSASKLWAEEVGTGH